MTHFVKLYASILDSTIWAEPAPTVKVWITLLTMADANGFVDGTLLGVMRRAIVSRDECETAIRVLESPDPDSKTPDHEGRRIERREGGWQILNHRKYRDLRTEAQIATAQRVKQHRDKKKALRVTHVTKSTRRNGKKHDVRTEVDVEEEEDVETTKATTSAVRGDVTGNGHGWPAEGAQLWSERVTPIDPGRFGKAVKKVVQAYGWPTTRQALECYLEIKDGRPRRAEWFAEDAVTWVRLSKMPTVDPVTRELTEKGRLAYHG